VSLLREREQYPAREGGLKKSSVSAGRNPEAVSQVRFPHPLPLSHWKRGVGVRESDLWDGLGIPDDA